MMAFFRNNARWIALATVIITGAFFILAGIL
jgi:hypothetical protein